MAWYKTNDERPKIPPAKALWAICPKCRSHFEKAVWAGNGSICPKCNYHGRLSARERIAQVADAGTFEEVFREVTYSDHLAFRDATDSKNYDIVQINYKLIAGTTYRGLNLYSMKKYELITRFEVEISKNCDNIIYMVNEDILCLGGNSTITLLSIKSFEIVFKYSILNNFYITEICILSDYNILVAMHGNKNNMEYFYQYKYRNKMNESTNKKDSKLEEVSYKLVTEKDSNVTMKCLSDNRLISIINYNKIQIWK